MKKMSKKVVNIEKIDLDDFLQKLVSLYEEGMDFIDMELTIEEGKETEIKVITRDEYKSNIIFDEDDLDEDDFDNLI